LPKLLKFLHDEEKVAGVTVLRGIAGFNSDGKMHLASLIDLSLDLPLVVEFYDRTEKTMEVIAKLKAQFNLPHIVSWPATWHVVQARAEVREVPFPRTTATAWSANTRFTAWALNSGDALKMF
jgi:PII-like signaling protein